MTEEIVVTQPIRTELMGLADHARAIEIINDAAFQEAGEILRNVKAGRVKVEEIFEGPARKAHEAHKAILELKRSVLAQADEVDAILRPKVAAWIREQDRLRFEAERQAALAAAKIERVSEKAIDKAHELVDAGKLEEADTAITKAKEKIAELRESVAVPEKAAAQGVSVTRRWTFEIVNEDRIPAKYKKPDRDKIQAACDLHKHDAWKHLPGCRVFQKDVVNVKASK